MSDEIASSFMMFKLRFPVDEVFVSSDPFFVEVEVVASLSCLSLSIMPCLVFEYDSGSQNIFPTFELRRWYRSLLRSDIGDWEESLTSLRVLRGYCRCRNSLLQPWCAGFFCLFNHTMSDGQENHCHWLCGRSRRQGWAWESAAQAPLRKRNKKEELKAEAVSQDKESRS